MPNVGVFLPESFKDRMKELLGTDYTKFLASYEEKPVGGIRVNTLKLSPEHFNSITDFALTLIPWIQNGSYLSVNQQPARHPHYYAGLYYIQEPSAMTPANLLPVNPGDRVLDLCAAPGGKSTELGTKLRGKGVLVANDISNSRAKALLKNIELFGIQNSLILSEAPVKLAGYFTGFFDKILVDAPCSGEGMFRKSPSIIKNWEQYGVEYYHKLQKEILPFAVKMLRPGGLLLYSTCTFSPLEDEGSIKYLLEQYHDLHVIPIPNANYKGFAQGRPEWAEGPEEIRNAIRLWPHHLHGEGHFIALLQKDGGSENTALPAALSEAPSNKPRKDKEADEFFSHIGLPIEMGRVINKDNRLYLMPEGLPDLKGLRVLRSGLLLGELKKNRFEPSQALAMALKKEEYDNCYDLPADHPDILKYLKCETIFLPEDCTDGWMLVCVDGYPLGWGKASKGILKNKYLPGWRWM